MNERFDKPGQLEILPVGRGEEEAAQLPEPVRLSVTCSPRRGPDQSAASRATPDRLHEDLAHYRGDRELGVVGFHFYTFNQLLDTWQWERDKRERRPWPHSNDRF